VARHFLILAVWLALACTHVEAHPTNKQVARLAQKVRALEQRLGELEASFTLFEYSPRECTCFLDEVIEED